MIERIRSVAQIVIDEYEGDVLKIREKRNRPLVESRYSGRLVLS